MTKLNIKISLYMYMILVSFSFISGYPDFEPDIVDWLTVCMSKVPLLKGKNLKPVVCDGNPYMQD